MKFWRSFKRENRLRSQSLETTNPLEEDVKGPEQMQLVVGLAGGSGSGKTTIATMLVEKLGSEHVTLLSHDSYYRDLGHLPKEERANVNFDHPDSLDTDLMVQNIIDLKDGKQVNVPIYDFQTHSRKTGEGKVVTPTRILLVEGILLFTDPKMRDLMDIKIYVDCDPDIRFIRRLKRDVIERGRTVDDITEQYLETVRPMHMDFVEPCKRFADVIIPEGGHNSTIAMDMIVSRMQTEIFKKL